MLDEALAAAILLLQGIELAPASTMGPDMRVAWRHWLLRASRLSPLLECGYGWRDYVS
jgi:hypothetical protein